MVLQVGFFSHTHETSLNLLLCLAAEKPYCLFCALKTFSLWWVVVGWLNLLKAYKYHCSRLKVIVLSTKVLFNCLGTI